MSAVEGRAVVTSSGFTIDRARPRRLASLLAKGFFVFGSVAMLLGAPVGSLWVDGLMPVRLLAWPLVILTAYLTRSKVPEVMTLEASEGDLVLVSPTGERNFVPHAKIAGATVVERSTQGGRRSFLEIDLENGDRMSAQLAELGPAHALVRAIGFTSGGRRVRVRAEGPLRRWLHLAIAAAAYFAVYFAMNTVGGNGARLTLLSPLATLALYTLTKWMLRAPEVTVGDDGVVIKSDVRSRFVTRRDIADVTSTTSSLVITKTNGQRVVVHGFFLDGGRLPALARAIQERCAVGSVAAPRLAHYARAGRTITEWRAHLAAALNDPGYRSSGATTDDADAVLRDPNATAEQRVGAALALRAAGEPKERIRVAAEGAADARLRVALETVAETEDDPEPLERALEALS